MSLSSCHYCDVKLRLINGRLFLAPDSSFKPEHPEYDPVLGFRPCRRPTCPEVAAHPWHRLEDRRRREKRAVKEQLVAQRERMAKARAAKRPRLELERTRQKRFEHETSELERLGVRPVSQDLTESGEVLRQEWSCFDCDGRGWTASAWTPCSTCHGRGRLQWTRTQIYHGLIRAGKITPGS